MALHSVKRILWQTDWWDCWLNDVTFIFFYFIFFKWPLSNYQAQWHLCLEEKKKISKNVKRNAILLFFQYNGSLLLTIVSSKHRAKTKVLFFTNVEAYHGSKHLWVKPQRLKKRNVSCIPPFPEMIQNSSLSWTSNLQAKRNQNLKSTVRWSGWKLLC